MMRFLSVINHIHLSFAGYHDATMVLACPVLYIDIDVLGFALGTDERKITMDCGVLRLEI